MSQEKLIAASPPFSSAQDFVLGQPVRGGGGEIGRQLRLLLHTVRLQPFWNLPTSPLNFGEWSLLTSS